MSTRNLLATILIIFILSIGGMYLWRYDWVSEKLYSTYIDTLVVIFAFMIPFIISKQMKIKNAVLSVILLYIASIFCYFLGLVLCYAFASTSWLTKENIAVILISLIPFVIIGVIYRSVTDELIKKNKKSNMLLIMLLAILTIPLSLVSIKIYGSFVRNNDPIDDWVDAVRMGYPVFWITIMLGLSGIVIARQ